MTFDMRSVEQSKAAKRRELAALPIAEKLRILDALRERTIALRSVSCESERVPIAGLAAEQKVAENR